MYNTGIPNKHDPIHPFSHTNLNGRNLLHNGSHILRAHLVQQALHLAVLQPFVGWKMISPHGPQWMHYDYDNPQLIG